MGEDSGSTSEDSLGPALDAFLDWAEEARELDRVGELPARATAVAPGSSLGEFELVRPLGSGGMGVVFEACQRSVPGRRVAVKVLRDPFPSDRVRARFRREVAAVGRLDHPDVVPIVAAGVQEGLAYFAMPFLDGLSAAHLVRELRTRVELPPRMETVRALVAGYRPTPTEGSGASWESSYARWVARVGLHVAEALQHAHERGVLHRDVKPGNLVLRPTGRPVLLDFGLATHPTDPGLTGSGEFLGTLAYAPPEQVRGEEAGPRGDVYSLGATLYELLGLRRPFESARRSELLRDVQTATPSPLGAWVPRDLRTVCQCALAKEPRRRYASAGAMAHDLRELLAGRPIRARPPGLAARASRWVRAHPRLAAAAVSALALAGGFRTADVVRAGERVDAGRASLLAVRAGHRSLNEHLDALAARAGPAGGADFFEQEALRDEVSALRRQLAADRRTAESSFRGAFEHVGSHARARRGLAELYGALLEQALHEHLDLVRPEEVALLEERLAAFDDGDHHAALRARQGRVRISGPVAARLDVWSGGDAERPAGPVATSALPADLVLPEGSYLARVTAPGCAPAWLPFVVRRDACYARADAHPPRSLHVEPVAEGSIPTGYVHVPGGWTLVEDDPPRWEHVPTFQIQRHEATYADLLGWARAHLEEGWRGWQSLGDPEDPDLKPRYGDSPGELHVVPAPGGDGLVLRPGEHAPDTPVRGLAPMEVLAYATSPRMDAERPGWISDLPSSAEWVRAARGADARPYPWGHAFEWSRCGGHPSDGSVDDEPGPYRAGEFAGDVSPFGVHDLAGSVAELTRDMLATSRDQYVCRGGSYRCVRREDMRTTAHRAIVNKPEHDVGFRLVRRPAPAWMRPTAGPPGAFHDDFEAAAEGDLPHPWREAAGDGPPRDRSVTSGPRCAVQGGALVLVSRTGNYSPAARPWRPVAVSPDGFRATAVLRAEGPCGGGRTFGLVLACREPTFASLGAKLELSGERLHLDYDDPFAQLSDVAEVRLDTAEPVVIEVGVRGGRVEARAWPASGRRPRDPVATLALDAPAPFHLLGLSAPRLVEARIEVDEVAYEPVADGRDRPGLLVPQGLDGVHGRGAPGGVEAEDDAHAGGDAEGDQGRAGGHDGAHVGEALDE